MLKEQGTHVDFDFSTEFNVEYQYGRKKKTINYYNVNESLLIDCKYLDFVIANTRTDQKLTFELVKETFVTIRSAGEFIASIACCCKGGEMELNPEPHKAPKQTKHGILYARHESAEPAEQALAVEAVEMKPQPQEGDNMKTMVQQIIDSLVYWMEILGTRKAAVSKTIKEIQTTAKDWNDAFELLGWKEWSGNFRTGRSKENLPAAEQPTSTQPETPEIIEHTTKRGKVIRGIVRHDLTRDQAKAIDEYTFAKNGGWFIREKHLENLKPALEVLKPEQANEKDQVPVRSSEIEPEPAGYKNGSTWYGGRYDSALSTTDITKKIRQHLKEEAKKNPLFVSSRFSVRKDHHKSITVSVLEMQFNPLNPERIKHEMEGERNYGEKIYTPDGQAFFDRIKAIVDSYNFDGSDLMTDYFYVNFYCHVSIDRELEKGMRVNIERDIENQVKAYRKKLRDSWPTCSQCGKKDDRLYNSECGKHENLCFTCVNPFDQAERERRAEEHRKEREETARKMATLADVALIPVDDEVFLDVLLPSLNKNNTIEEYTEQRESGNYAIVRGKVTDRAKLTAEQYDVFVQNLLENVPWLAGKGGCGSTADLPEETDDLDFFKLTPDQQAAWKAGVYSLFVEVSAPGRETVYIDPQGFEYARYLGFAVNPSLEFDEAAESQPCVRISEEVDPQVARFEVGKTYYTRSLCDHNCIYEMTVAKRTEKTITTTDGKIYRPKVRTNCEGKQVETVAMGNYSMASSWDATDTEKLLKDWEQPAAVAKREQAEQMDLALIALDSLLDGVPIDTVMKQWQNDGGTIEGESVPPVTPSPAKASTDCSPVNRWNNHASIVKMQGATKAPPTFPEKQESSRENAPALWGFL